MMTVTNMAAPSTVIEISSGQPNPAWLRTNSTKIICSAVFSLLIRVGSPGTGFTIEPGVYFSDFGVRSEINVIVHARNASVTGAVQTEILALV